MRVLLDTHTVLWFFGHPVILPSDVLEQIEAATTVWVSVASLWEIAIKVSLN